MTVIDAPTAAHRLRRTRLRSRRRGASHPGRPAPRPATLDAVIVGGGPAGLSAALVLGRARRRVLVLDTDRPANAPSNAVGGLLAQGGVAPAQLRRAGREQLADHPTVELRGDEVLDAERTAEGLSVPLDGGASVRARALVLAHGLRYDPPPLPGVERSGVDRSSTAYTPPAMPPPSIRGRLPMPSGPARASRTR